jgi:hypothetical protein
MVHNALLFVVMSVYGNQFIRFVCKWTGTNITWVANKFLKHLDTWPVYCHRTSKNPPLYLILKLIHHSYISQQASILNPEITLRRTELGVLQTVSFCKRTEKEVQSSTANLQLPSNYGSNEANGNFVSRFERCFSEISRLPVSLERPAVMTNTYCETNCNKTQYDICYIQLFYTYTSFYQLMHINFSHCYMFRPIITAITRECPV